MTKIELIVSKGEKIQGSNCPECGRFLDAASGVIGGNQPAKCQPRVGDISICFCCGVLLKYGENLQLRRLTEEEIVALKSDERNWEIINHLMEKLNEYRTFAEGLTILGHGDIDSFTSEGRLIDVPGGT